jgi:nucleotide-binding universal stress UspA family protein
LDAGLAPTLATFPDVEVEQVVDWRRPTIALQDLAKGAQLLVVGSRGRGAFKGLVMGSTSRVMIQHAPCPVLVVPSHPEVVPAHPKAADVAG